MTKPGEAHNVYMPSASLAGCQDGQGIYVQTVSGQSSAVTISNDKVTNYNKNGITCNDAGTTCSINGNTASFYTPYEPYIGPNGIQVAFGANGTVGSNTVENNACTLSGICGRGSAAQWQSDGCGIITYQAATGTKVSSNTATGNDIGICVNLDTASVISNKVSSSNDAGIMQYDGIGTYSAASNTLSNNPIGVEILNDGTGTPTFTSSITGGTFGTDPIRIQIQTVSPGTVTLHYGGYTDVVSGTATDDIS